MLVLFQFNVFCFFFMILYVQNIFWGKEIVPNYIYLPILRTATTILSLLGYTLIPIDTRFSQWGYQQTPIGKKNLATASKHQAFLVQGLQQISNGCDQVSYTLSIGIYFNPDWHPSLPMRIPTDTNRPRSGKPWGDTDTFFKSNQCSYYSNHVSLQCFH